MVDLGDQPGGRRSVAARSLAGLWMKKCIALSGGEKPCVDPK